MMCDEENREVLESLCWKAVNWVREELSSDETVLWDMFLEYDASLDGHIDRKELAVLLTSFDSTASAARINRYMDMFETDKEEGLTFCDICEWWEMVLKNYTCHFIMLECDKKKKKKQTTKQVQKDDTPDSPGGVLAALLKARYVGGIAARYTWDLVSATPFQSRLSQAPTEVLQIAVDSYRSTFYDFKRRKAKKTFGELIETDRLRYEQVGKKMEADPSFYSPIEKRHLRYQFYVFFILIFE